MTHPDRREHLRQLALADAARRCPICRRALPLTGCVQGVIDLRRYCSEACRSEAWERQQGPEGARD